MTTTKWSACSMRGLAQITSGIVLSVVGFLGVIVAALGLIDPAGTKLADDGDPFGSPDPWYVGALIFGAFAACAVVGLWLLFGFGKRRDAES